MRAHQVIEVKIVTRENQMTMTLMIEIRNLVQVINHTFLVKMVLPMDRELISLFSSKEVNTLLIPLIKPSLISRSNTQLKS